MLNYYGCYSPHSDLEHYTSVTSARLQIKDLQIDEILRHPKSLGHGLNCNTLVGLQKLGIHNYSDFPHKISEVWLQVPVQLNMLRQAS